MGGWTGPTMKTSSCLSELDTFYAEPLAPIRAGLWPLRRVLRVVNRPNDDTVE